MISNKVFFLKIPHVSEKLFNSHLILTFSEISYI